MKKKTGQGREKDKLKVAPSPEIGPTLLPSKAWERLRQKKQGATFPRGRKEKLIELPDGELVTRERWGEILHGKTVAPIEENAPPLSMDEMRWQDWPVPCPDCSPDFDLCALDPVSKQKHHWTCPYWDRTGRNPF